METMSDLWPETPGQNLKHLAGSHLGDAPGFWPEVRVSPLIPPGEVWLLAPPADGVSSLRRRTVITGIAQVPRPRWRRVADVLAAWLRRSAR